MNEEEFFNKYIMENPFSFKNGIIAQCRELDKSEVYEWVANDELKIRKLIQEKQQLKEQYCERTDCSGRIGNSKRVEELERENKQLKKQLQQKENIINEITNYCKFQIEKEQDKFPKPIESEEWLKGRISAFEEILDNKGE